MKKIITQFTTSILCGLLVTSTSIYQTNRIVHTQSDTTPTVSIDNSEVSTNDTLNPETPPPESPPVKVEFATKLIIKAINPGYTVDGVRDVGEFIELQNVSTDNSLSLAGYSLHYINSSGKSTTLLYFSEGSTMVGEFLLFRLARTADSALAEATYTTTLAMSNGRLELQYNGEVVDQVCWSKDETCSAVFDSKQPTTLVRDLSTGSFQHVETYETHFVVDRPTLKLPDPGESPEVPETPAGPSSSDNPSSDTADRDQTSSDQAPSSPPAAQPQCQGLEFSEIFTYYADSPDEQFIELYNPTDSTIKLNGCSLRYKKKSYALSGEIAADGYYAFYPVKSNPSFTLTKNPSSSNTVELIDVNDAVVDALIYIHGQKKSTSYAKFYENDGSELWSITYAVTPRLANNYQEFRTCPAGKIINPVTGNCIKVTMGGSTSSAVMECPEGKYRNPLTGRCKNIESSTSTELKPCAEGYERNPETNRCRKIKSENTGADYALVPTTYSDDKTFTALGVVLAIVAAGVTYIILQFRHEIARMLRKLRQRFHHVRKDLISGHIGFHRHKKP